MGYQESIQACREWQVTNSLTYQILSDMVGNITLDYTNFLGMPMHPWTAIVSVDRILEYSDDTYAGGEWHIDDLIAVFESLFAPVVDPEPDFLDFDVLAVGTSEELELVIYNDGTGLLEITDITTSHPDFTVDVNQGEVFAMDDSLVVTVTFTASSGGSYDEILTIHSPSGNVEVPLSGLVGVQNTPVLPDDFRVDCYPNPFNAELTVQLALQRSQHVGISVVNIQGAVQEQLWQNTLSAGINRLTWSDPTAPSGIYFIEVRGDGWSNIQKIVMIR